jgi:DNA-binding transcriptional MerR regulator
MRSYDSEDQVLQALIETNIRQRGTVGGSAKKTAKRFEELERIYGIEHGGDRRSENRSKPNNSVLIQTQKDLAKMLGISVDTIQNYKTLLKMIPELEDLVDTGIVSTATALAIVKELSPEEQKEFLKSLPEVEKLTEKKARELMASYKAEQENSADYEEVKQELATTQRRLGTTEKQLEITEEERSEFKKKYSEAKDELKRYKETFGNDKNILSATHEIQLLTAATNEYVKRHGGKVWAFNEFDKLDSSVKEDYIKSLKMLNAFTQQMIINVGGNIV